MFLYHWYVFLVCTLSLSSCVTLYRSVSCHPLFLCIHEMMVIFHDHSNIKSSAPPLRQCSFYSSYFLRVITFRHSVSPSSSAPISVLSFQSNSSFFPSRYQGGARIGHLQTHMNESGPAHFLGLFTKVYWLSV